MSVLDFLHVGSSLALRSFSRMGSSLAVVDYLQLGSSLSIRCFARLGNAMSVLDFVQLGSTLSLRSYSRIGATLAVLDFVQLGSSLSLRSFSRLGAAISVFGIARCGASLSLLGSLHLGASVSLRSFARLGASLSVLAFVALGSSLSVRAFARLGSAMSLLDFAHLGSTLSLRSYARFGASLSVLDFLHLGSSLSLRSFARVSSALSVLDYINIGSTLSLRDVLRVGRYFSVQESIHTTDMVSDGEFFYSYASGGILTASQANMIDFRASMAEVDGSLVSGGGAVLGSRLGTEIKLDGSAGRFTVRYTPDLTGARGDLLNIIAGDPGSTKKKISIDLGESSTLHGSWTAEKPMTIKKPNASILFESPWADLPASAAAVVGFNSTGTFAIRVSGRSIVSTDPLTGTSTLHGDWNAGKIYARSVVTEDPVTTSDRRLKRDIRSLRGGDRADRLHLGGAGASTEGTSWLLRQLRPVSFRFKRQESESKRLHYGFIADEVQRVIPDLVRTVNYGGRQKVLAVAYQDLIAFLVSAMQAHEQELLLHEREHEQFRKLLDRFNERLERLESHQGAAVQQAADLVKRTQSVEHKSAQSEQPGRPGPPPSAPASEFDIDRLERVERQIAQLTEQQVKHMEQQVKHMEHVERQLARFAEQATAPGGSPGGPHEAHAASAGEV